MRFYLRLFFWCFAATFVGVVGWVFYRDLQEVQANDRAAVSAGFKDHAEMTTANIAGIKDAVEWHDRLAKLRAEEVAAKEAKAIAAQKAAEIARELTRDPSERMSISNSSWSKGGFGSIGMMNMTINNSNDYAVKDISLRCTFDGKSGTQLSERFHTVYDTIPAKGKKAFREVNVGFIDSQSARGGCSIVSARRL